MLCVKIKALCAKTQSVPAVRGGTILKIIDKCNLNDEKYCVRLYKLFLNYDSEDEIMLF